MSDDEKTTYNNVERQAGRNSQLYMPPSSATASNNTYIKLIASCQLEPILADRTNGRAYATVLRLSVSLLVVCDVMYCG